MTPQYVFDLDHYELKQTDAGWEMVAIMKGPDDDHTMVGSSHEIPLLPLVTSDDQFDSMVRKLRAEGWDDLSIARQFVDDTFRHTGHSMHMQQHIVEWRAKQVKDD